MLRSAIRTAEVAPVAQEQEQSCSRTTALQTPAAALPVLPSQIRTWGTGAAGAGACHELQVSQWGQAISLDNLPKDPQRVWRETWSTALALKAQSAASWVKTRMEIFKKLPETQLRGRYLACNSRVETSASTWRAVSSF